MSKLHSLAINDTGFAFDPTSGESYTLNEMGIKVIYLFKQGGEVLDMARAIAAEFDVEFDTAYRDIMDFKNKLQVYGLGGGLK